MSSFCLISKNKASSAERVTLSSGCWKTCLLSSFRAGVGHVSVYLWYGLHWQGESKLGLPLFRRRLKTIHSWSMGTWEADIYYYPPKAESLGIGRVVRAVYLTADLGWCLFGEECLLLDPVEEAEVRLTAGEGDLMPPQEWASRSCYLITQLG